MRNALILVGVLLLFSVTAAAQGPAGVGAGHVHGAGSVPELVHWQLSLGYQYNRINLTGSPFNTDGLNTSVVRFLGKWFGLEGQLGAGFGNTGATTVPVNLAAKSIFAGGGPRLAYRGHGRFEPWVHAVVGMEHFRFTQTTNLLGNNTAFGGEAGGGTDFNLNPHAAFRMEVDWIDTRFFQVNQRHFQAISGLVLNF